MLNQRHNFSRILFDLHATQTPASKNEGVGRYSSNLFKHVAEKQTAIDVWGGVSDIFQPPDACRSIPKNRILRIPKLPELNTPPDYLGGDKCSIYNELLYSFYNQANPDIVHISHVFEGFDQNYPVPMPISASLPQGQILSATVYDLIPLIFEKHYLQNEIFEKFYRHRLSLLYKIDLLIASSESTRQDHINILGIDQNKIVTIHGGYDPCFKPSEDISADKKYLRKKCGIQTGHFVLYTGGDDYVKNIHGLLEAYIKLSPVIRKNCSLVIVCEIEESRKAQFKKFAQDIGLNKNEISFLGYVGFNDLIKIMAACDCFIFPSLYEGLGLPVLEAMACEVPVIGSDNSSIGEFIANRDAVFDAAKPESITRTLERVLGDKYFAQSLRQHCRNQAKKYTWQNASNTMLDAYQSVFEQKNASRLQFALLGGLAKKRLAVLSPLPPVPSGISGYMASFLPFLNQYFEIDLYVAATAVSDKNVNAAFRIFQVNDFEDNATNYDIILYEIGNSGHHAHMLPLLTRFPGVVMLHDAYLSSLMWWMEHAKGDKNVFSDAAVNDHGSVAQHFLAPRQNCPNAIEQVVYNLPCTKSVLDHALGVISHTVFNLNLARQTFPENWRASYQIIPQISVCPVLPDEAQKAEIRSRLGFDQHDFIVATFGHISWTKDVNLVLDAFLLSRLSNNEKCHFIYAGALAQDSFGVQFKARLKEKLKANIKKPKLSDRVKITGFLSDTQYQAFLSVADIAIQLRTNSRGGTSACVLGCMAHQIPVIINNDASFTDFSDDAVYKLSPSPGREEIKAAFEGLYNNDKRRTELAFASRSYVKQNHDPNIIAASYACALNDFGDRKPPSNSDIESKMMYLLRSSSSIDNDMRSITAYMENPQQANFCRPKIIVDVSHTAEMDHKTGIQRTVKEITVALSVRNKPGLDCVPVRLNKDGELLIAYDWMETQGIAVPQDKKDAKYYVEFCPGDHFLMLDSSWERYDDDEFTPYFEQARRAGVPITTVVYDILPIRLPKGNFVGGIRELFRNWLHKAIAQSDNLLCISQSVAEDLATYIKEQDLIRPDLRLGWWHLGADLKVSSLNNKRSCVHRIKEREFFLMVGTLEPRKNHVMALNAFEILWQEGWSQSLVFAGKKGWHVDALHQRIKNHAHYGEKLFLFEDLDDDAIQWLYKNAKCVLVLSHGEGFGLPLIEAAHHNTPIICSDIPVFHEIGQEFVTYAEIESATAVADKIKIWVSLDEKKELPASGMMKLLSWAESAEFLLEAIMGQGHNIHHLADGNLDIIPKST